MNLILLLAPSARNEYNDTLATGGSGFEVKDWPAVLTCLGYDDIYHSEMI